ncbi:uncharacterized protein [Lepeophtheirus salmonis]|uniref:uncharacterized protein isoform X2 n=1 Tax=Lepeophtheirus salmonis TaxID=72036 RepID=UPI001AEA1BFD|nr:uncharacterized protein LOC121118063 isoform X2 [Lepeophtheirus salmonis]
MDWFTALSDITKAQDEISRLTDEVNSLDQLPILEDVSTLKTLEDNLKNYLDPWILRDLQSFTTTLNQDKKSSSSLPLPQKYQETFVQDFKKLIELHENIRRNRNNKFWLINQDWAKIAEEFKTLEVRFLRMEAQIDKKSYLLEKK